MALGEFPVAAFADQANVAVPLEVTVKLTEPLLLPQLGFVLLAVKLMEDTATQFPPLQFPTVRSLIDAVTPACQLPPSGIRL